MAIKKTETPRKFLATSNFQNRVLAAATDPDTTLGYNQQMTVRWAFRILPGLPPRTLRRAFDKIAARHDSLRLRFVKSGDGWQAEILPHHPHGLVVEDLTSLSEAEQIATIEEYSLRPLTALSPALYVMTLFRCGKAGDTVLIRAHHAIIDGYSIPVLIEETLKIIMNVPLFGKPPGHGDYIERVQALLQERETEKEAFWQDLLLPLPDDPQIGRKAKGLPPISPQTVGTNISINNILSEDETKQLHKRAKVADVSTFSYLYTAFCEAICELSNQSEFMVITVLGRTDAAMSRFVGSDINALFIKYQSKPGNLDERARLTGRRIADASQNVPSKAMYRGSEIQRAFEAKAIPIVRFMVHMPTPLGRLENSPFRKLFSKGMDGKVSLGFFSAELIDLPRPTATDFELAFQVSQTGEGANASLISDESAFTRQELDDLIVRVRRQLGFEKVI